MTWKHLCAASKLSDGEPHGFTVGEQRVALYNVDNHIYATEDVCSHAFALLSTGFLEEHIIECPLHGAMFDIRSGKCQSSDYKDIRSFPVEIRRGEVYVDIDEGPAEENNPDCTLDAKT